MEINTLETLLNLARREEDRSAAQLSVALRQLERAQQIAHQLHSFGNEYRLAAVTPGVGTGGVGFANDALAFGQRLHGTAFEQQARVREQEQRCEVARQALAQARSRADGLQRLWQKAQQQVRLAGARRAERVIDDWAATRWGQGVGTKRAVS